MWQVSCNQSGEQEEQGAALEAEIALLKAARPGEASGTGSVTSGQSSPASLNPEPVRRPARRGKAPTVDSFIGEDPTVKLEHWLLALKRASL